MPLTLIRQNIVKMRVDAIVNAANTDLVMGGGVSGAIFNAAGPEQMQAACDQLAPIRTGEAVITPGFSLPAKFVIHTAGPIYRDGKQGEKELLTACYVNALKRAVENDCESVAFPLISSGIYGYPKAQAMEVAREAIRDFLSDHEMDIFLVLFDRSSYAISEKLLGEVRAFISDSQVDYLMDRYDRGRQQVFEEALEMRPSQAYQPRKTTSQGLEEVVGRLDEPFSTTLLRLIDAKGKTDVEVYKRANIDRKLFSKIRSNEGYMPSKRTVIALAIGLGLDLAETSDLLERAGYALSKSQLFDVIIRYFISKGKYNIFEINEVLFNYDQPLLGG